MKPQQNLRAPENLIQPFSEVLTEKHFRTSLINDEESSLLSYSTSCEGAGYEGIRAHDADTL